MVAVSLECYNIAADQNVRDMFSRIFCAKYVSTSPRARQTLSPKRVPGCQGETQKPLGSPKLRAEAPAGGQTSALENRRSGCKYVLIRLMLRVHMVTAVAATHTRCMRSS